MHFKSKHGFTLIEVLFTLMLIALVVTPLMFQQSMLVRNVDTFSRRAERMFAAQTFLYEARKAMQDYTTSFTLEKKIDDGDATLSFSRGPVGKKSAFARARAIYQDRVVIVWQENGSQRRDQLITLVYVQPQEGSTS